MAHTLSLTTPSDREIVIRRDFDAPRDLVFEAFTTPALVRRWLLGPPGWTMPVCEIDLRPGGRYRYVWSGPENAELALSGMFKEIVPPERIVSAETFDVDWTGGEAVITMVLTEADGLTTMTQTILYASKEACDGAKATGMAEGMGMGFDRLDELLHDLRAGDQSSSR